jgi:tetratricopeptide (TPR) repeat protein
VLQQLLDESLDAATFRAVEAHVETCDHCQECLARLTNQAAWSWLLAAPAPTLSRGTARGEATAKHVVTIPGFEILGELGQGGHGVVYKARQTSLNRLVALKVARQGVHATAEERVRLGREARAVAQLCHPHIVQVHAVEEHEGVPFLVMEFVEGGSLAALLDGTPWPARRAAELVQTLARAIHAAHERGIVHRDLKPANVLLQADSTAEDAESAEKKMALSSSASSASSAVKLLPKITDFGIARQPDAQSSQTPSQAILGTPSYMAPEQASGQSRHVGGSADVYALGAILYELLTGRPPFKAETHFETLLQVRQQEPVPPRRLVPKLPGDLETICLKCLRKEPASRYATARELAEDLNRHLRGEPIQARPTGPAERLYRWCRRNPVVAGLVVGLFVVLASGLTGVTYLWRLAEQRSTTARQEKEEADRQRQTVERIIGRHSQAFDDFLQKAISNKRLQEPGLEPLRKALTHLVLGDYTALAQEQTDNPDLQRRLALATFRAAQVSRLGGDHAEALRLGESAAGHFEKFVQDRPDSLEDLRYLAWIYSDTGLTLEKLNRPEEAFQAEKKALAVRERMVEINPAYPRGQRYLAWSYTNLGAGLASEERYDEARDYFQRALAKWPEACRAEPADTWLRMQWAMTCQHLGDVEHLTNHPALALRLFKESHDLYVPLAEKAPQDHAVQERLAESHVRLGRGYRGVGENDKAQRAYEQAALLQEKLRQAYPDAGDRYIRLLSETLSEKAALERALGQPGQAAATTLKRRALWPANPGELYQVACDLALCIPLVAREKEDERRRCAELAMETLQQAIRHGFQDWQRLDEDRGWEPLRARPDFQALRKAKTTNPPRR